MTSIPSGSTVPADKDGGRRIFHDALLKAAPPPDAAARGRGAHLSRSDGQSDAIARPMRNVRTAIPLWRRSAALMLRSPREVRLIWCPRSGWEARRPETAHCSPLCPEPGPDIFLHRLTWCLAGGILCRPFILERRLPMTWTSPFAVHEGGVSMTNGGAYGLFLMPFTSEADAARVRFGRAQQARHRVVAPETR